MTILRHHPKHPVTVPLLAALLMLAALALPARAGAAGDSDRSEAERALERAETIFDGGPVRFGAGHGAEHGREPTLLLAELAARARDLGPEDQERAWAVLGRPDKRGSFSYFGKEAKASPHCNDAFCVHWARGRNAPDKAGSGEDGIPAFVEDVLDAATTSAAVQNGAMGWAPAKADRRKGSRNGVGDSSQVDLYLTDLGDAFFGLASPDPDQGGNSQSAYLVLDNDYTGFAGDPTNLMQVTTAHEYNHVLQFGYDAFQDPWFFESTATWIEEFVYPEVDDYLSFVPPFARKPHKPLAAGRFSQQPKIYGAAVWNHWLSSSFGPLVVRDAWAASAGTSPPNHAVSAYDAAIAAAGGPSFEQAFATFAAETAEWHSSAAFPDVERYPEVRRRKSLRSKPERVDLDHTGYALFNVQTIPAASLRLIWRNKGRATRSGIALVGRTGPQVGGTVEIVSAFTRRGSRKVISIADPGRFDRLTAVVVNADGRIRRSGLYSRDDIPYKVKIQRIG